MTVIFFQKINSFWAGLIDGIEKEFPGTRFITDPEEAQKAVPEADIFVCGPLPEETWRSAVTLKLVIVPFSGVNHIPYHILNPRGVRVANSHGNARYVAERAVSLILAFYGKVVEYHKDLENHQWHGFWVGKGLDDTWESIHGKTCAILGAGEIGGYTARFLKALGVGTVGFKRNRVESIPEEYDEMVYNMDEAIEKAEIIVLALPSTEETRGCIDARRLSRMAGKVLVNVGRGDVVDEEALYCALQEGSLKGAALDCWYTYPAGGKTEGAPGHFPFEKLPNMVMSPHVAGYTKESSLLNVEQAFENLRRFLASGDLLHEVDTDHAY